MSDKIKRAVQIADSYRNTHDGEIPLLVVCNSGELRERVIVGSFRKGKENQDQKMLCSVLRTYFALNDIQSYEVLIKPAFKYTPTGLTKNILAVVSINRINAFAEFFEIEDEELIPYMGTMPVDGIFTEILPSVEEREYCKALDVRVKEGVTQFIENCTVKVEVLEEKEPQTADDMILSIFSVA